MKAAKVRKSVEESIYEYMMENVADKINTWDEMFDFVESVRQVSMASGHVTHLIASNVLYAGFLYALRVMPEEGDIKVLVEATMRAVTIDAVEVMGYSYHEAVSGVLKAQADQWHTENQENMREGKQKLH